MNEGDIVDVTGDMRRDDPDVGLDAFDLGMNAALSACSTVVDALTPAGLRLHADRFAASAFGPWTAGFVSGMRLVAEILERRGVEERSENGGT